MVGEGVGRPKMVKNTTTMQVVIDMAMMEKIDAIRGLVPRSAWLRHLIEKEIERL